MVCGVFAHQTQPGPSPSCWRCFCRGRDDDWTCTKKAMNGVWIGPTQMSGLALNWLWIVGAVCFFCATCCSSQHVAISLLQRQVEAVNICQHLAEGTTNSFNSYPKLVMIIGELVGYPRASIWGHPECHGGPRLSFPSSFATCFFQNPAGLRSVCIKSDGMGHIIGHIIGHISILWHLDRFFFHWPSLHPSPSPISIVVLSDFSMISSWGWWPLLHDSHISSARPPATAWPSPSLLVCQAPMKFYGKDDEKGYKKW